jgi:hypothetical protein
MKSVWHTESGKVDLFPQQNGWVFVRVPRSYSQMYKDVAGKERGLVPVDAKIGQTTWPTSLLPMGDGTHFIALNARVRKAEDVCIGDTITFSFRLRSRN